MGEAFGASLLTLETLLVAGIPAGHRVAVMLLGVHDDELEVPGFDDDVITAPQADGNDVHGSASR